MTWLVESFDPRTDGLLAEVDLDVLASGAVERLIGAVPQTLAPDQVRVVAPLFDVDPERWTEVVPPSAPGSGWLAAALDQLVGKVLGVRPEEFVPSSYPVSPEAAQELLGRFSPDAPPPPGEVFLSLVGP